MMDDTLIIVSLEPMEAVTRINRKSLRALSSTGPDLVPARILKRSASQLAKPMQSLLQRMIETDSFLA